MRCLTDPISAKMAFFPPQPPSYQLAQHGDGERETYVQPTRSNLKKVPRACVFQVGSKRETIVAAFLPAPGGGGDGGAGSRWTLLHSHGNAVDLGEMLPLYEELARLLRCNVLAYDYAGYGCSSGSPSASQTLADVGAVLGLLRNQLGKRLEDTVLYGQSVGSGPTSYLAARTPGLAGVVLHSPFLSGMRVLQPGWRHWPAWCDIFPNHKLVPKIRCPVLVMHGLQDDVISVDHARQLHALCREAADPLWEPRRGHQDLEASSEFIPHLRRFLAQVWGDEYKQHLQASGARGV